MTTEFARGRSPRTIARFLWGRSVQRVALMRRRLTAARRPLPDFLVIGAQKAGTSSLHRYIFAHPDAVAPLKKEVHFFDLNHPKGPLWYRSHFDVPNAATPTITGETSPYYLLHPAVPQRVREMLPDVKLIAVLRNPVDRAFSHYHGNVRRGRESLPFDQALDAEAERLAGEADRLTANPDANAYAHRHFSYQLKGVYVDQLERWRAVFPEGSLLVLRFEDLAAQPQEVMRGVYDFLGLSPFQVPVRTAHNAGRYDEMSPEIRERLSAYFAPHNERLYNSLGRDFGW